MSLHLQYPYVKERRYFGRPVKYFLRSEVLANYAPNKNEGKRFLTKWTMDKSTEKRTQFAVASVNTENAEYTSTGMCHLEGGYGKDVDANDEEQTLRYKKKLQRSEEYRVEMTRNLESMKKAIMQNAGINIYENYFEDRSDGANVVQYYRHPNPDVTCPATKVSFSIEQSPKLAVAYSQSVYDSEEESPICPLVWDLTQSESFELNCESSCCTLTHQKRYWNVIAGGLQNGNVCLWDVRNPTETCLAAEKNHDGYVTCLRWSQKSNFELASGSSNGEVYWFDIRKMDEPSEFKIDAINNDKKSSAGSVNNKSCGSISTEPRPFSKNACTTLEFDKARSKNIRIGTADGRVILGFKNDRKIEKSFEMKCHEDWVSVIGQNWSSYKSILTVDSCDVKIWDEDMDGDPIFAMTSIENEFTCGTWSRTRYSRFFIGKVDGSIQFWDLTFNHDEPYFTLKPASNRLNDIQTNVYGTLMACCCSNGDVHVIEHVDAVPGIVKDFPVEEMNFEEE